MESVARIVVSSDMLAEEGGLVAAASARLPPLRGFSFSRPATATFVLSPGGHLLNLTAAAFALTD